jgi:plastocyanin
MRRKWELVLIVSILVAALAVSAGCGKKAKKISPTTTGSEVKIANFAFNPGEITVTLGTEVTWINEDSTVHTVTDTDLDSGEIKPGESFKYTFPAPGTYEYHCSIHPSMTGKVVVSSSGSTGATTPTMPSSPEPPPPPPGY